MQTHDLLEKNAKVAQGGNVTLETCQGHERHVLHCQGALCIARKGPQGLLEGETPVAEQPAAEGTNPKRLMGK